MDGKTSGRSSTSSREDGGSSGFSGRMVQLMHMDFDDGGTIIAPGGSAVPTQRPAQIVGDILDIACKIWPDICKIVDGGGGGGGGGGGKGGCYTIIGPDGTKITICPPGSGGIA